MKSSPYRLRRTGGVRGTKPMTAETRKRMAKASWKVASKDQRRAKIAEYKAERKERSKKDNAEKYAKKSTSTAGKAGGRASSFTPKVGKSFGVGAQSNTKGKQGSSTGNHLKIAAGSALAAGIATAYKGRKGSGKPLALPAGKPPTGKLPLRVGVDPRNLLGGVRYNSVKPGSLPVRSAHEQKLAGGVRGSKKLNKGRLFIDKLRSSGAKKVVAKKVAGRVAERALPAAAVISTGVSTAKAVAPFAKHNGGKLFEVAQKAKRNKQSRGSSKKYKLSSFRGL